MSAKTALITGANRGLGLETGRQLGKLGYTVILGSRRADQGAKACSLLSKEGINAHHVELDVQSEESVTAAAKKVSLLCTGKLDALVNNAGYYPHEGSTEVDVAELTKAFDINVAGAVRVTNHFLPLVRKSPAGRIVNVGSDMGTFASSYGIASASYSISKAALHMYTLNLANSLANTSIKVNAAHPGWVQTDMGGSGAALTVEEGAKTSVYLATLPPNGPTGGLFHNRKQVPW